MLYNSNILKILLWEAYFMKVFSRCCAILLICCLLMALLPLSASADTYDIFTYEIKDNQVTITGCAKNTTGKVVIPDTIEGCPVTTIGEQAFRSQSYITEIVLPDSVKTIEEKAFFCCRSMTAIRLPSGLTVMNDYVLADCSSLTSLHIPASVKQIVRFALYDCPNISTLTVESGNKTFYSTGNCLIRTADKAVVFANTHSTIPTDGSVTTLAKYAFLALPDLVNVSIPRGITTVESGAISSCDNLVSIHLSDTVTSYASQASSNSQADNLSTLTVDPKNPVYHSSGNCIIQTQTKTLVQGCKNSKIPTDGSITAIGTGAFTGAKNLTAIAIPEGVTAIGSYPFSYCSDLVSVSLPSTLQTVGEKAFNATGLTEIIFPSSVTTIGRYCLDQCKSLKTVTILNPNAEIYPRDSTFYGNVTIYGYPDSTAEAYAKEYGKTFVALDPHACSFDQKVSTDKYLSAPASCTAPAKYYYSCTCGEKGSKTFTHGKALPHTYDNACDASCNVCNATRTAPHSYKDAWKNDELVHWHECTCGAKNSEAAHIWDDGTTTDAGTVIYGCTVCAAQRAESIVTPPEVTEPTVPSDPEPTTPVQTEPAPPAPTESSTTPTPTEPPTTPAPAEPSTPAQKAPSLIWILPVLLVILALLILIIFLLKRKKDQQNEA